MGFIVETEESRGTDEGDREEAEDFFFHVFAGNYPNHVRTQLMRRGNWIEVRLLNISSF
jgi:hypothetical protein